MGVGEFTFQLFLPCELQPRDRISGNSTLVFFFTWATQLCHPHNAGDRICDLDPRLVAVGGHGKDRFGISACYCCDCKVVFVFQKYTTKVS